MSTLSFVVFNQVGILTSLQLGYSVLLLLSKKHIFIINFVISIYVSSTLCVESKNKKLNSCP